MSSDNTLKALYNPHVVKALSCPFRAPLVAVPIPGVALLAPLAFLMGLPFPLGLQRVSDNAPGLVPWAWAINGCLSVTGATLATLIAVHLGFRILVLLAALCYLATIPVFRRLLPSGLPEDRSLRRAANNDLL